jgi:hypothetical protein
MAKPAKKKPAAKAAPPAADKKGGGGKGGISFGAKLKAWWDGYDAKALAERDAARNSPVPEIAKEAPVMVSHGGDRWNSNRVDIAQLIWGDEFTGPGDAEFVVNQCKLLGLTPEMSMLDLTAGLGGPMRVLADHFGVWASGFETSPTLIEVGNELSQMHGMSKKAPLKLLDMTLPEPFERRYDRAFGRVYLSKWGDLALPLARLNDALKPDAMVLFNDYFLTSASVRADDDFITYQSADPSPLSFHVVDEVLAVLKHEKLEVRVNENITDSMSRIITDRWKSATSLTAEVASDPERRHLLPTLLREAEVWTHRVRLMSEGKLEMRRIMATKPPKI